MPSSFFSAPEPDLDPRLFLGQTMHSGVRTELLRLLFDVLDRHFSQAKSWTRAWVAGSGVSYQWSAARDPGDLDVLIGIEYVKFRYCNPTYRGLGDVEISKMLNDLFRSELQPHTANWSGFEVTWYVNPRSWDITAIKPYAAYSLTSDDWTVAPDPSPSNQVPNDWETQASDMQHLATMAVSRYADAHAALQNAPHEAARVNAQAQMKAALAQAAAMYDQVHEGRKIAFGHAGQGYADRHNFLWQAGKRDGWLFALRDLKEFQQSMEQTSDLQAYGVELPDTDTLIRRAAQSYAAQAMQNLQ